MLRWPRNAGHTVSTAVHQLRRYLREAEQVVDPRQRLDLLTQHVLDVWLWTLAQVIC